MYMALTGPLETLIKPELLDAYYAEYFTWFPRQSCAEHHDSYVLTVKAGEVWVRVPCCEAAFRYDIRTPGLFKEEFRGDGIVALNSKTYFCWGMEGETENIKYSSKGLSKRTNQLSREQFLNVINTGHTAVGVNTGFQKRNNKLYTYEQTKAGLSYFYAKRRVMSDGVSTKNIDV